MRGKSEIRLDPKKLRLALEKDPRMEAYHLHVGNKIRNAAIRIFVVSQRKDNELRTSEYTPPKYVSSFRVNFHRKTLKTHVTNVDPGWSLVEYGAHPGGRPDVFVLRYKPLTRALLEVAVGV